MPSAWMLYPDGIIPFQQHHFSSHDSHVVHELLSLQANVEFIDWPPWAPDMNPIENTWREVKRTMQETWPILPPKNSDELWSLVSDTWGEVASSQHYVRSLNDSVTRQMKSGVEAQGFWTFYN
jgi:hypothetical protein